MADIEKPEGPAFRIPDPTVIGRSMADIAERSQRIVADWLKRQPREGHRTDPLNIGDGIHGDDGQADGQPGQAGASPDRLLAGLHDALAEHRPADDGAWKPTR